MAPSGTIATLTLVKPVNGVHLLVIKATAAGKRAGGTTIIDTRNRAADRTKVTAYLDTGTDGSWDACPANGFGSPYDNQTVAVNMTGNGTLPAIWYYCWTADDGTYGDWRCVRYY